jgi:outer membrane protein TolC
MRVNTILLALLTLLPVTVNATGAKSVGLGDAVSAAITNNLSIKLAAAQDDAARAAVLQNASALLPTVLGTASQTRTFKYNINAVMGMGGTVGPFNTFDMRLQLTQSLFDYASIERYKAAKAGTELSEQAKELAREQVAAAAELAYIDAARAHNAVVMAQADFDLAKKLLELAQNQHDNGLVTGLDVARAKTRLSDAQVFLLNAQSSERQSAIRLKRVAGWPLDTELALIDDIDTAAQAAQGVEELVCAASSARPELKMYRTQARMDLMALSAAKSARLPVLSVSGNYGLSGNQADSNAFETSGIGAYLSVPLFTGGSITAAVRTAQSAVAQSGAKLEDARIQIEEDVRLSGEIAQEAQQETELARERVALAQQELAMSQDRYAQGVGDNIEVVTAQVELANVHNSYVTAVAKNQTARVNLALAAGKAQSFTLR